MLRIRQVFKALMKFKISTWLTVLSLVISFMGIITLVLYVSFEKSFDRFGKDSNSVYRLETLEYDCSVPAAISDAVKDKVPGIDKLVTMTFWGGKTTTEGMMKNNTSINASLLYSSEQFFDVFPFRMEIGDKANALTEPYSVVLTKKFSKSLFGDKNPLGETVFINNEPFKVTAVMQDFPENSSFSADCVPSFSTLAKKYDWVKTWSEWSFNIFVKLDPGKDPVAVAKTIEGLPEISEHLKDMQTKHPGQAFIKFMPLKKIHFVAEGSYSYVNPVMLNVFILLALILAVMGAVNFINFSTSQAPARAKSLSIMRVLGSRRGHAMGQIVSESVILSVISFIVALLIFSMVSSHIESLFKINGLGFSGRSWYLIVFLLFAVLFGIIAGLYPSRYITSSPLAQTIKGNIRFTGKGKVFRNGLIVLQFVFTIGLLASAFIIEKQINYWKGFDIGIKKDNVVYINTSSEIQKHYQAFADELLKNRELTDYTYSQFIPGNVQMGWGREIDGQYIQLKCWPVDERFLDFFGIQITEGRKFSRDTKADINGFILNEAAVKDFGWKDPLAKQMEGFDFKGPVIGIAKNFNFSSLKEDIGAMQFWLTDTRKNVLMLRANTGNYTQLFSYIKKTAQKFDPENPVEPRFLNDSLNKLYAKEERMGYFIEFVALWCMLLAITGLLGLVVFICRDRIKEIGIRKVNGATIPEILQLINMEFIRWVAVSFVIAVPVAWIGMHKWVETFAYKTSLNWWVFVLAGLITFLIAILTVTLQSYKAATRNPVDALRYE
jgi:putative ABC transport system permease protein